MWHQQICAHNDISSTSLHELVRLVKNTNCIWGDVTGESAKTREQIENNTYTVRKVPKCSGQKG